MFVTDPTFWKATGWAVLWISIVVVPAWVGWKMLSGRGGALSLGIYMWCQDIFRRDRRINR